jgi:hypothetical protein
VEEEEEAAKEVFEGNGESDSSVGSVSSSRLAVSDSSTAVFPDPG